MRGLFFKVAKGRMEASPKLGIVGVGKDAYVWRNSNFTSMKRVYISLLTGSAFLFANALSAQVQFGIKVGANYLISSQKIQPDPKDAPTNPKGLGLVFGAYVEVPFSDMVGLRPELGFSFRRAKSETTVNTSYTNDTQITNDGSAFTGTKDFKNEIDQRLTYLQLNVPLTLKPAENLRIMLGPSFNFLMGGKQNVDQSTTWTGTTTGGQQQQGTTRIDQQDFVATKKKGSAAIKDYTKVDVAVLAGIGYTLPVGLDMDLRFYRGLTSNYDRTEGKARVRSWTNLIEFSLGWTFGG